MQSKLGRIGRTAAGAVALGLVAQAGMAQQFWTEQGQERERQQWQQQQQDFRGFGQMGQQDFVVVGIDVTGDGRSDTLYMIPRNEFEDMSQRIRRDLRAGRFVPLDEPEEIPAALRQRFPAAQLEQRFDRFEQQQFERPGMRQWERQLGQQQQQPFLQVDPAGRTTNVSGTIQQTRNTRLPGVQEQHKLAQIRTEDGRTLTVDLGPTRQAERLDLDRGDEVEVRGRMASIGNQRLLLANTVTVDDETINVRRPVAGTGDTFRIQGEIRSKEEVVIGDSEPYIFARVRTDEGDRALVNLGPRNEIEDLDLSEGDRVSVVARRIPLMGQTVYHAERIQSNGQTVSVQQQPMRDRMRQMQQQRQQQQQRFRTDW